MRRQTATRRAAGFSLLEVLVAFVILSLVATAVFRLFSGGLGNASAAEEWSRALAIAESRLAETAAAQPLVERTDAGQDDTGRIRWETRVAAYTPPEPGTDPAITDTLATRLYRISVQVTFPGVAGRERTLDLHTLKLAARATP